MTEDRENDGRVRRPASEDGMPRHPPDSSADADEGNELESLVPDRTDMPDAPEMPDTPDTPGTIEPIPVPEASEATEGRGDLPTQSGDFSATEAVEDLRKQVATKDAQLAQVMTAYRQLKKETERLRKRIETHQKRRFEQSKNDFIGHFVEVLDNLDRAIDSIENNFDSDAVLEGIILVRSRLVQLLREEGLEKIFVGGQSFDPTHSEAAGIEPVEDSSQDNVVLKELQRGYMLKGALLRPARVIVGRYSHVAEEAPAGEGSDESPPAGASSSPDGGNDPGE